MPRRVWRTQATCGAGGRSCQLGHPLRSAPQSGLRVASPVRKGRQSWGWCGHFPLFFFLQRIQEFELEEGSDS